MFSRIFKRQEPLTLAEKVARLDALSNAQLIDVIHSDSETALKQNAIARLDDPSQLLRLATASGSDPLTICARKRLGKLLDQRAIAMAALASECRDTRELLELCSYSETAGVELLATIEDEQTLAHIATSAPTTAIRQGAAKQIESEEWLNETLKLAKDKDKSVFKIVKAKLAHFKDLQAKKNQLQATAESLCQQARMLEKRDVDEIFTTRRAQIEAAWVEIEPEVDAEVGRQFAALQTRLIEKQRRHQQHAALEHERNAAKTHAESEFNDILAGFTQAIARMIQDGDGALGLAEIQGLQQRFSQLALPSEEPSTVNVRGRMFEKSQADALALAEFFSSHPPLNTLLDQLQSSTGSEQRAKLLPAIERIMAFADLLPSEAKPASVTRAQDAISEVQAHDRAEREKNKQLIENAFAHVRRVNNAARTGKVRRAKALYAELEKIMAQIEACPPALQTGFVDTTEAMSRLGDWHDFAVTPKKQALITRMNDLCQSHLPPKDLAEEIKLIQDEWKLLSRGGQTDDSELWASFQEAGRKAFEPCRIYFAEQEAHRAANLDKREALCESIRHYLESYDWENANWREVEKTLRLSRDAWTSYWPVDRKQNKPLQSRFDGLMDTIHQKLDAEFERNRSQKEKLIAQAAALTEAEDNNEAIAQIKQLQKTWQALGNCKPGVEQKLWRSFRTHCDAIFARRKSAFEALAAQRQKNKTEADALTARFDQLLALTGDAFRDARPEIDRLIDQFAELGELPKADATALRANFKLRVDRLEDKVHAERRHQRLALWEEILVAFRSLMTYELNLADASQQPATPEKLAEQLRQNERWPREAAAILESRCQAPEAPMPREEAEQHFRRLCVQAETINGRPSPQSDQALRMAYQVEQLQHGLGKQNPDRNMNLETYLQLWLQAPALNTAAYAPLEQRMRAAWGWGPLQMAP